MQISSHRPIRVTPVRPSVAGATHQPVKAKAASTVPPTAVTTKAVATKDDQPQSLSDRFFSAIMPKGSVPMALLGIGGASGALMGATMLMMNVAVPYGILGVVSLFSAALIGGFVGGAWAGDGLSRLFK